MNFLKFSVRLFVFSCFALMACASAPKGAQKLDGMDIFGTSRVDLATLQKNYGPQLEQLHQANGKDLDKFAELYVHVVQSMKQTYGFEKVEISLVSYFNPTRNYITIDVVESKDVFERAPFSKEPAETHSDPGGLIGLWGEYFNIGMDIQKRGGFTNPKTCPAWHCIHGFEHPELAKYGPIFDRGARKHQQGLERILRSDRRPEFRANAAYLLAHTKDGQSVVDVLVGSMYDPSMIVRNAVIRVLGYIFSKPSEIKAPIEPFLRSLEFPTTLDRNKTAWVLGSMSTKPQHKERIARVSGPTLLKMLDLKQPNNHDPAWEILKNISGQSYGENDFSAWETWFAKTVKLPVAVNGEGGSLPGESPILQTLDRLFGGYCPLRVTVLPTDGATSMFHPQTSTVKIDSKSRASNYQTVLAHEMAHLCLYSVTKGASNENAFRFLDEGYASVLGAQFGGQLEAYRRTAKAAAFREANNKNVSFRKLKNWKKYFGTPPSANWDAYSVAADFIFFLRDTYGEGRLFALLQELAKDRDFDRAVMKSFGLTSNELEAQWLGTLKGR